jgi:hypothetical protein
LRQLKTSSLSLLRFPVITYIDEGLKPLWLFYREWCSALGQWLTVGVHVILPAERQSESFSVLPCITFGQSIFYNSSAQREFSEGLEISINDRIARKLPDLHVLLATL